MKKPLAALLATLLLASACSSSEPEFSAEPTPNLAAQPGDAPIPVADDASGAVDDGEEGGGADAETEGEPADGSSGSSSSSTSSTTAPAAGETPETTAPQPRTVFSMQDAANDQGLLGPDYADISTVTVEDIGENVRVTVRVGAGLPNPLADGEVIGLGVDFFVGGDESRGYQLFAIGNLDGWFAYVQQPEGFIEYPGVFRLGGDLVQFEVPWDAIGGEVSGTTSAFLDWAEPDTLGVVANSSRDDAPNGSPAAYQP